MKNYVRAALATGLCFSAFAGAQAATLQVTVTGHVTSISDAVEGLPFAVGDAATYSFIFQEVSLTPDEYGSAGSDNAIVSFTGQVGSYVFSGNSGTVGTWNNATADCPTSAACDQISVGHFSELWASHDFSQAPTVNGVPLAMTNFYMSTGDLTFLQSNNFDAAIFYALASNPSYLSAASFEMGFSSNLFNAYNPYVEASIDSVSVAPVPVPAAAWLLGSGLAGLFGFGRKRSVAA